MEDRASIWGSLKCLYNFSNNYVVCLPQTSLRYCNSDYCNKKKGDITETNTSAAVHGRYVKTFIWSKRQSHLTSNWCSKKTFCNLSALNSGFYSLVIEVKKKIFLPPQLFEVQRWKLHLHQMLVSGEVVKLKGSGKCITMLPEVKWQQREISWHGAEEWWWMSFLQASASKKPNEIRKEN